MAKRGEILAVKFLPRLKPRLCLKQYVNQFQKSNDQKEFIHRFY